MKKLVLALLLMQTPIVFAAADKPNPADYTVTVHVVSSASLLGGSGTNTFTYQMIEAVIGNETLQLRGGSEGVLALGDYSARVSASVHGPKDPNTYDVYRGYDFLMPDGKVRTYVVTRLGPAVSHP